MTDRRDFNKWLRFLRREFPSCYPVRVSILPREKMAVAHNGLCTATDDRRFTITICEGMDWQVTQETLFEEWAHLLRFHLWGVKGDEHDAIYGAIFNTIKAKWHD